MLPLWLLERYSREPTWDAMNRVVVAASDEEEARGLAAGNASDEGPETWRDENQSLCEQISTGSIYFDPKVVIEDVNEG